MELIRTVRTQDHIWSKRIFNQDFGKTRNYFFYFFSTIFMEETAALIVVLTYFFLGRSLQNFIVYLITFVANIIMTVVTKKLFARPRPTNRDFPQKSSKSLFFRNKQSNHSLPSGDTIQAVNLAWFIYFYGDTQLATLIFLPTCLLVAYSRVYLCCHFISDTVIGGIIAILTSNTIFIMGLDKIDYPKLISGLF